MILPLCAIVAIILLVIAMRFWDTSGIKETISIACMIFDLFAWAAVIIMCIAAIT